MRSGRSWLMVAAVLALAGVMPAVGRAAGTGRPLTLGVVNWIGYGPIYCAAANGYYRRYGRDVKLVTFSDNSQMAGAVQGAEIDATTLTYDQVLLADARGMDLKVIMPVDYSAGGDAIVASTAVRSLADLKGRRVAYQPGSPSDFLLGYALGTVGLAARDIRTVPTTPDGVPAVLASGALDAGVTYEPNVSTVLAMDGGRRFHVLLSSRQARGMITDVLVVTARRIARDPQLPDELIRGTLDGLAFMRANPGPAAAIIGRVLGIPAAQVSRQLQFIENPDQAHLGDVFRPGAVLPSFQASGRIINGQLMRAGQVARPADVTATYDDRFVKALQAAPRH